VKVMESLLGSTAIAATAIVFGATPVLAHTTITPSRTLTADVLSQGTAPASWHATVSGAELFNGTDQPVVNATARSCLTVTRSCPTAADLSLTLTLTRGTLQFGIESITALLTGDGNLRVDAVLDVNDATGLGGGWVISQDGPQTVQMLQSEVDCLGGSSCFPGRPDERTTSGAGHLLFAAQRNTGMGPQRVHVVFQTAAAVQDHWSFSIAPQGDSPYRSSGAPAS
jgi:hypothetical protein